MKTGDLTTGWKTRESELLAHAVVQNVTGFAETRNEIHRSASLAQNAHVDWHTRLSHRGRLFTPRQLGVFWTGRSSLCGEPPQPTLSEFTGLRGTDAWKEIAFKVRS